MWIIIIVILLLCALLSWFLYYENHALQVSHFAVNLGLRHSVKIVHLSDLHGKQFGINNRKLEETVDKLDTDLYVYTGDLIDDDGKNIDTCAQFLGRLAKKHPVFFVPGNNEHQSGWYERIIKHLKENGVTVLEDQMKTVEVASLNIAVLGFNEKVEPYDGYGKRSKDPSAYTDYSELFQQLESFDGLKLVLTHYPENYSLIGERSYGNFHFDMMFAGHAHGGQFILPLVGGVFAPGQGLFPKFTNGLYGDPPRLCVSRGLGASAFPFRLFNRPQIIELTIL